MNEHTPTIPVSEVDLRRLDMLLTTLKIGKFSLSGDEALGLAQVIEWLARTHKAVAEAVKPVTTSNVIVERALGGKKARGSAG